MSALSLSSLSSPLLFVNAVSMYLLVHSAFRFRLQSRSRFQSRQKVCLSQHIRARQTIHRHRENDYALAAEVETRFQGIDLLIAHCIASSPHHATQYLHSTASKHDKWYMTFAHVSHRAHIEDSAFTSPTSPKIGAASVNTKSNSSGCLLCRVCGLQSADCVPHHRQRSAQRTS